MTDASLPEPQAPDPETPVEPAALVLPAVSEPPLDERAPWLEHREIVDAIRISGAETPAFLTADGVAITTTGIGKSDAATTVAALLASPGFDLDSAYVLSRGSRAPRPRRPRSVPSSSETPSSTGIVNTGGIEANAETSRATRSRRSSTGLATMFTTSTTGSSSVRSGPPDPSTSGRTTTLAPPSAGTPPPSTAVRPSSGGRPSAATSSGTARGTPARSSGSAGATGSAPTRRRRWKTPRPQPPSSGSGCSIDI
jgi:hypothetical protein